ncbi:MAG: gluconate 2-dehydrogenase subunit 3 family protein [Candidatus Dormibacteria bacterium]
MGTTPGRKGRFPGYDVVAQAANWDPETAGVVLARLDAPGPLRFFNPDEALTAEALLDRLLAQSDEPKVPLVQMVDARLADGIIDGYRYEDMPSDADAWHQSLAAIEALSQDQHGRGFHTVAEGEQNDLLERVRGADRLGSLPAKRVFGLWMRYGCAAFYSHPWAWNEIGYGGPAYPRGYKNLGLGRREPWEVVEARSPDPGPWAERLTAARQRHAGGGPASSSDPAATSRGA